MFLSYFIDALRAFTASKATVAFCAPAAFAHLLPLIFRRSVALTIAWISGTALGVVDLDFFRSERLNFEPKASSKL